MAAAARALALAGIACLAVAGARALAREIAEADARAWIDGGVLLAVALVLAAMRRRFDGEPLADSLALRRPAAGHVAGALLLAPLLAALAGEGGGGGGALAALLLAGAASELLWRGPVQVGLERSFP